MSKVLPQRFHYIGMLRSPASWAKVARQLLLALLDLGYEAGATEYLEDRYQSDFPLPSSLEAIISPPKTDDIVFSFCHPADYPKLSQPPKVGLLVHEATRWPPHWMPLITPYLEMLVVPSAFCRRTLIASGYPDHRICVVPHGIDPTIYHPQGRHPPGSQATLKLLFVGTPARRKGLDILLQAFEQAFVPTDPVVLVIKTLHYPDAASRPYLDQEWAKKTAALRARGYRIDILTDVLSEPEIAELYRSADLLCQPFRGEGFALPLLEAMACGTPVLATGWSGPLDFLDETVGLLLRKYTFIPAESMLYDPQDPGLHSMMVEPAKEAVIQALRFAAQNRHMLSYLGKMAHRRAASWTWKAAATRFVEKLRQASLEKAHLRKG